MSKIKIIAMIAVLTIVISAIPLFASCTEMSDDTQFINDAAENILISMNDADYTGFSKDFDETMKAELTEAAFPDFVSAINGSNGNYKAGSKKLTDGNVKEDKELIFASYLADFVNFEDVIFEVTFKDSVNGKKVIGLWFQGPSTNLFIGTTSNNIFDATETVNENQTVNETKQQTPEASNLFDARDIKEGDSVAGMKVVLVDVEPGPDPNNEDNYFAIVKFSGKLELSGKYISYSNQPLLGRSIIFYPDRESANLIPRLKHENAEEIWFVFEKYDETAELLSYPDSEGTATIIIDNYTINYTLEAVNTAEIAEVLKKDIINQ